MRAIIDSILSGIISNFLGGILVLVASTVVNMIKKKKHKSELELQKETYDSKVNELNNIVQKLEEEKDDYESVDSENNDYVKQNESYDKYMCTMRRFVSDVKQGEYSFYSDGILDIVSNITETNKLNLELSIFKQDRNEYVTFYKTNIDKTITINLNLDESLVGKIFKENIQEIKGYSDITKLQRGDIFQERAEKVKSICCFPFFNDGTVKYVFCVTSKNENIYTSIQQSESGQSMISTLIECSGVMRLKEEQGKLVNSRAQ